VAHSTDVFNIITGADTLATYTPVPLGKTLVKSRKFNYGTSNSDNLRTNNLPQTLQMRYVFCWVKL